MNLVAVGERLARQAERLAQGRHGAVPPELRSACSPASTRSSTPSPPPGCRALALAARRLARRARVGHARGTSEEAGLNSLAVAFAMLGFAIGLQFDQWWAVVGWAIESAAIVWVGLKSRRDWMRLGGALLLGLDARAPGHAGFFEPPAGFTPVFNATRRRHARDRGGLLRPGPSPPARTATSWPTRPARRSRRSTSSATCSRSCCSRRRSASTGRCGRTTDATADLARPASLSVAWAVYGTVLIVVGIVRRYAPVRYLAIALLAADDRKVFLFDLLDARRHLPDHRLRRPRRLPAARRVALSAVPGRDTGRGLGRGERQSEQAEAGPVALRLASRLSPLACSTPDYCRRCPTPSPLRGTAARGAVPSRATSTVVSLLHAPSVSNRRSPMRRPHGAMTRPMARKSVRSACSWSSRRTTSGRHADERAQRRRRLDAVLPPVPRRAEHQRDLLEVVDEEPLRLVVEVLRLARAAERVGLEQPLQLLRERRLRHAALARRRAA